MTKFNIEPVRLQLNYDLNIPFEIAFAVNRDENGLPHIVEVRDEYKDSKLLAYVTDRLTEVRVNYLGRVGGIEHVQQLIRCQGSQIFPVIQSSDRLVVYTAFKGIGRLNYHKFTCPESFERNMQLEGIALTYDRTIKEITDLDNAQNIRIIPVKRYVTPDGHYFKYKLYYIGDPLDYSTVEGGVHIASHFHSRHKCEIFGNLYGSTNANIIETLAELTSSLADNRDGKINHFKRYGSFNRPRTETENKALETDQMLGYIDVTVLRGLVDDVVQTMTVNRMFVKLGKLGGVGDPIDLLRHYRDFKQYLQLDRIQLPNPEIDISIILNPLVNATLRNILAKISLIVASRKFYRGLQHLGLIANYKNVNSDENRMHVWRVLRQYTPNAIHGDELLSLRTSYSNAAGSLYIAEMWNVGMQRLERTKDGLALDIVLGAADAQAVRYAADKLNIECKVEAPLCQSY